jgi:hypothetical protein
MGGVRNPSPATRIYGEFVTITATRSNFTSYSKPTDTSFVGSDAEQLDKGDAIDYPPNSLVRRDFTSACPFPIPHFK